MYNLLKFKSIRKYLSVEATKVVVLSMFTSHLDYCNSVLTELSKNTAKENAEGSEYAWDRCT